MSRVIRLRQETTAQKISFILDESSSLINRKEKLFLVVSSSFELLNIMKMKMWKLNIRNISQMYPRQHQSNSSALLFFFEEHTKTFSIKASTRASSVWMSLSCCWEGRQGVKWMRFFFCLELRRWKSSSLSQNCYLKCNSRIFLSLERKTTSKSVHKQHTDEWKAEKRI